MAIAVVGQEIRRLEYARSECSTQGGRRDGELRSRREEDEGSVKDGWWRHRPNREE